ncbi:MAG: fibronectin type III domain-containing protein [Flavobacteriales bacterium]
MNRLFSLALLLIPVALRAQAPNDLCANATLIACGQALNGTTAQATADAAPTCGTTITAPGVWFRIVGNGQQITVSTCPDEQYDTKLNVYTGTCGALVCVGGNDDANGDVFCSTVSFVSEAGVDYLVLVQGYNGDTGPFTLTATCAGITADVCQGALPIACGNTYAGTTESATSDAAPFCETGITAPGVWYTLTGNGQQVSISTCPDEQYDTKLNVYSGSCTALVCVAGNDDAGDDGYCSTVVFFAEAGAQYFVLVQGYDGETGQFDLAVTCQSCGTPQNLNAIASDVEAVINWTSFNTNAGFIIEYGPVGFTQGTGTLVNGTSSDGPPATISGLAPGTEYEAYVREACGNDESAWAGPVSFTTFTDPPATNANCSGALPLTCGGEVTGNTSEGLPAIAPTCASANVTSRGLWYTFTGNGDDATLSTCVNSAYDTKLSVFTGTCSALICAAGNDDGPGCTGNTSEVTFQTTSGTTYLVLVHGYGSDEGDFTLRLTCTPACTAVSNDDCAEASLIEVQSPGGCESSTGTTICAFGSVAPNPPCDPYANIVDAWYAFNTGWAVDLQLIIELGTAEFVNAALYTACGSLEYVECWTEAVGAIDLNGLPPNTDMLVRVWNGGGSEAGSFSICVEGNFNVGMNEAAQANGSLWPVPAQDELRFAAARSANSFTVLDAQGRLVLQGPVMGSSGSISIARLERGAYMLLLDGRAFGRFIKD